jgi:hypothetical protein
LSCRSAAACCWPTPRSTRLRFEVRAKLGLLGNPLDGRLRDVLEPRMKAWIEREKSQR